MRLSTLNLQGTLRGLLQPNPIIVKELRARMRGPRAFITLTLALVLMAGVSYVLYRMVLTAFQYSSTPVSPQVGQTLLAGLMSLLLAVISAVAPAVTAGAISGEQERQTYEMLLATPLRPASILWGKLISALSYVFLLLFAAVPMSSLVFIFGGVALRDMLKALVVLAVVTVMFGVIGLFFSTALGRSGRATVVSYLTIAALLLGPLFAYIAVGITIQNAPPRWMLIASPINALFSALAPSMSQQGVGQLFWVLGWGVGSMPWDAPISQVSIPRPLYHYSIPLYILITIVLYLLSTRLVQPTRRWRLRRRDILIAAGILLLVLGAIGIFFGLTMNRYEQGGLFGSPTPTPFVMIDRMTEPAVAVAAPGIAYPAPDVNFGDIATPPPMITPTPTPFGPGLPEHIIVAYPPPDANPFATPVSPSGELADLNESDQIAVYSAVIHRLYLIDHGFDQAPLFNQLYILTATDDNLGDPQAPRLPSSALTAAVQAAISQLLVDLPTEVIWVDSPDAPPYDETISRLANNAALISLGNLQSSPDGSIFVAGSLYVGPVNAGGRTYIVQPVNGVWQVTGTTGGSWSY